MTLAHFGMVSARGRSSISHWWAENY